MKKENKKVKLSTIASGAAMLGAFGVTSANAAELFNYEDLGSGSELRANLITADAMNAFTSNTDVEFECGEGKCGEGKCGEGKSDKKSDTKAAGEVKTESTPTMKPASSEKSTTKSKTGEMEAKPMETKPAGNKMETTTKPKN